LDKLRVGVVGLGNMGKNHVRNYAQIHGASLVAVCDVSHDLATSFASEYHCQGFTSLEEMVATCPLDALSITVPTVHHYSVASFLIQKGLHVLVEKPIADTVSHATSLVNLAEQHRVVLMVGHIERFNPAVQKLKSIITEGTLGKITSLIAKRVGAFPAQIKDANVIIDLAVHDIHIFSYLLDQQPSDVYGKAGSALAQGREDYAELFLSYGDQHGLIQVNWITPIRIRNLAVTGTKGYIELNYMTQELVLYESNYSQDFDTFGDYIIKFGLPNRQEIRLEKREPLQEELLHFLTCIRTKTTPVVSGENGIRALETALQVMKKMGFGESKKG